MAENKKSFLAYVDWKDTFDALPDDIAGKLVKHLFAYVSDENPESDDVVINAVFANIKNTLKRDLKKWEKQQEQRVEAGRKSAETRKAALNEFKQTSTTVERPLNEKEQASTVNVSVSVTDSVSDNVNVKEKKVKQSKDCFHKNIFLTSIEFEKLKQDFPDEAEEAIKFLSDYKIEKGYKTRDDNLTIRRWVIDAIKEKNQKEKVAPKNFTNGKQQTSKFQQNAAVVNNILSGLDFKPDSD